MVPLVVERQVACTPPRSRPDTAVPPADRLRFRCVGRRPPTARLPRSPGSAALSTPLETRTCSHSRQRAIRGSCYIFGTYRYISDMPARRTSPPTRACGRCPRFSGPASARPVRAVGAGPATRSEQADLPRHCQHPDRRPAIWCATRRTRPIDSDRRSSRSGTSRRSRCGSTPPPVRNCAASRRRTAPRRRCRGWSTTASRCWNSSRPPAPTWGSGSARATPSLPRWV